MLNRLWTRIKQMLQQRTDPMLLTPDELWAMGKTIMSFDFAVRNRYRVIETSNLALEFRGTWATWPDLRITVNGERVFDVEWSGRRMHVQTFRPGSWLIEYEQLWRVAETKRRLQKIIERRQNFDPI